MDIYFVEKKAQPDGTHDIHTLNCDCLPTGDHRIFLGVFTTCGEALTEARQYFKRANGCFSCAINCYSFKKSIWKYLLL